MGESSLSSMRAFLLGVLIACFGIGHPHGAVLLPQATAGPVTYWVADRGAGQWVGLDEDLYRAEELPERTPLTRFVTGERLLAVEDDPAGAHELRGDSNTGLAPIADVSEPYLLGQEGQVWCLGEQITTMPEAVAIAAASRGVWVASPRSIELVAEDGRVLEKRAGPAEPADLAADGTRVWVIDRAGAVRSARPSGLSYPRRTGLRTPRFASGFRDGAQWLFDRDQDALLRLDERVWTRLGGKTAGFEHALVLDDASLLALAPGSLHLLRPDGEVRLAQGGFQFAVNVVRAASAPR